MNLKITIDEEFESFEELQKAMEYIANRIKNGYVWGASYRYHIIEKEDKSDE